MSAPLRTRVFVCLFLLAAVALPAAAGVAPMIDSFVATPATPVPGQIITLTLNAHDPDCATTCSSGCGLYIRSDLLNWSDDSGRGATAFAGSTPSAAGSPWKATVTWTAPPADGSYEISAQVSDSGGMLCGGQKTTIAKLTVTVSSTPPLVIDSFTVTPTTVNAGGTAQLVVAAHDPQNRPLSYEFSATAGTIAQPSAATASATWTAPKTAGVVTVSCRVTVPGAPSVSAQRSVEVTIGTWSGTVTLPGYSATRIEPLPNGQLAVVDGRNGALLVVSRDGAVAWVQTGLVDPASLAVIGNAIYVLERRAGSVSRWSFSGSRLGSWPLSAAMPNDFAASPDGLELAVADADGSSVIILDPVSGAVKRTIGAPELIRPTGVWYSADRIAVADSGRRRLLVFNAAGALVSTFGDDALFIRPQSVAQDPLDSTWIVSDSFSGEVQIIDQTGAVRGQLAGFGTAAMQGTTPIDTAFLPASREVAVTATDGRIRFFRLVTTLPLPQPASNVAAADRPADDGGATVVTWAASPDDPARVKNYSVERDDDGDARYTRIAQTSAGTLTWTDTNAGSVGCHRYRIVASDGVLEATSEPSGCAFARNDLAPAAPSLVDASSPDPTAVDVSWASVTAPDLAGYVADLAGGGISRSLSFGPAVTAASFAALQGDVDYLVTLYAVDTAGNRSAGALAATHTWPDVPPSAPVVVAIDRTTGGTIDASWTQSDSIVPIDHYAVRCIPAEAGWPAPDAATTTQRATSWTGLVNELPYDITVAAVTKWGRESAPVPAVRVSATAPPRQIPVLARAGREGSAGYEESAGVAVVVPFGESTRTVRFLYRAKGTLARIDWNDQPVGDLLADTSGLWVEASVSLASPPAGPASSRLLRIRNASFPSELAELAVQELDLVPLAPATVTTRAFDTVIDVRWAWTDPRTDLGIRLERAEGDRIKDSKPPDPATLTWKSIDCRIPRSGTCRDTFVSLEGTIPYRLAATSPAGWVSDPIVVMSETSHQKVVTPVTDLRAEQTTDGAGVPVWKLDWTPVSYYSKATKSIVAIPRYRVYRTDGISLFLVTETAASPLYLPIDAIRVGAESFVVKSVADDGEESQ